MYVGIIARERKLYIKSIQNNFMKVANANTGASFQNLAWAPNFLMTALPKLKL